MIKEISVLTVVIVVLYFLIKKRRLDFLTIYCFSSLIYYLPLFFGKAILVVSSNNYKEYKLSNYFYLIIFLNFILLLFWTYIYDMYTQRKEKIKKIKIHKKKEKIMFKCLLILIIILFFITIKENFNIIFSKEYIAKQELLENGSRATTFFKQGIVYLTIYYCILRKYLKNNFNSVIIVLLNIFTIIFLAHRSYTVIAIIACFYFYQYENSKILLKNMKVISSGIIFFLIVSISKKIITPLKLGLYDLVIERLTNMTYITNSILQGEQSVTSIILNQVLINDYKIYYETYMGIISNFMIYGNVFFKFRSFSSIFQPVLFPFINYGMGSNFIAEAYSNGGIILTVLILNILFIVLIFTNNALLKNEKINNKIIFLIIGVYLSFYIHRNNLGQIITFLKRYLIFYLFVLIISKIKWRE